MDQLIDEGEVYITPESSQVAGTEPIKSAVNKVFLITPPAAESENQDEEFFDAMDSDNEDAEPGEIVGKRMEQVLEMARNFKPNERTDVYRVPDASKDGGFPFSDPAIVNKYRAAFKDVIKQVGKSIFSGKFNLASVSFPIKCMGHKSILELISTMAIHSPIWMNAAAQ